VGASAARAVLGYGFPKRSGALKGRFRLRRERRGPQRAIGWLRSAMHNPAIRCLPTNLHICRTNSIVWFGPTAPCLPLPSSFAMEMRPYRAVARLASDILDEARGRRIVERAIVGRGHALRHERPECCHSVARQHRMPLSEETGEFG